MPSKYSTNRQRNYIKLLLVLITFYQLIFQNTVQGICQTKATQQYTYSKNMRVRDTCQMCFFSFNDTNYFKNCKIRKKCASIIESKGKDPLFSEERCEYESIRFIDSSECQQKCCQYFSQGITSKYCKSLQDDKLISKIVVAIAIIIPVSCIVVFGYLGCKKKRQRDAQRQRQQIARINAQVNQESFIPESKIQLGQYSIENFGPQHILKQQNCTICLTEQCNIYTKCGHFYHVLCLRQWLIKRPICPVCMSKEYNPVKIYCVQCLKGIRFEILGRGVIQQNQVEKVKNLGVNNLCKRCLRIQPVVRKRENDLELQSKNLVRKAIPANQIEEQQIDHQSAESQRRLTFHPVQKIESQNQQRKKARQFIEKMRHKNMPQKTEQLSKSQTQQMQKINVQNKNIKANKPSNSKSQSSQMSEMDQLEDYQINEQQQHQQQQQQNQFEKKKPTN